MFYATTQTNSATTPCMFRHTNELPVAGHLHTMAKKAGQNQADTGKVSLSVYSLTLLSFFYQPE
jgi:hypothetical protein